MPVLMPCPNPTCDHPGPCGFSEGAPWGMTFYHVNRPGEDCPGMWNYNNTWYASEALAWKQYKRDNPGLDENWVKAFDARILRKDIEAYEKHIKAWNDSLFPWG